ncbi:MAG: AAA family ATPase [Caldilineales bacterium]
MPPRELTADQLRRACQADDFTFATTAELPPLDEIIGQERATRAIEFGLDIPSYGYNIYALGPAGAGKTTTIARYLQRKAAGRPVPNDWGYVHNFQHSDEPEALRLPAGGGRVLRDRLDALLDTLAVQLPKAFENESYGQQRKALVQEAESRLQQVNDDLERFAQARGFTVIETPTGAMFTPLINGKPATQEEFNALTPQQRKALEEQEPELSDEMDRALLQSKRLNDQINTALNAFDSEIAAAALKPGFAALQADYSAWDEVTTYLQAVQDHIVAHVQRYKDGAENKDEGELPAAALLLAPPRSPFEHYRINVVVDHSREQGAPVVVETNPTLYNLIGRVEQEAQFGTVVSNYSLIKGGSLLQANGGYLVVDARTLVRQPAAFEALKRALRHQQVKIEDLAAEQGAIVTASLKPEPIPLQVKVVLIGDPYTYYWLYAYDDEFQKLFKVRADFTGEMTWSNDNLLKVARFIGARCTDEQLPPFDAGAVAKVIEYSAWLVEDQHKLTTRFADIADILREAAYWARICAAGEVTVSAADVQRALSERRYRSGLVEERVRESILSGLVMIDVTGERIGQVNGLAVLSLGDTQFGKPTRITAKTYLGHAGVVNIEREAKLSGKTHDKGVLILGGYLGGRFAQDKPLSLTAAITFEQSYDGVDGDSASSSELYALLSALAEAPIRQGIAVTGSVNQHGDIQAIGGATAKIEGFFDVCHARGLTGKQGVIIPAANIATLMLREDVVQAVAQGQFHIYPVTTIDEGIAILTGLPAGERGTDGRFPTGSLNRRVDNALGKLALRLKNFGKPPAPSTSATPPTAEVNGDDQDETPSEPSLPGERPLPDEEPNDPELPGEDETDGP